MYACERENYYRIFKLYIIHFDKLYSCLFKLSFKKTTKLLFYCFAKIHINLCILYVGG